MDPFPFTDEEWWQVREAARAVVNATLADDAPLRAASFEALKAELAQLQSRYGPHPVLLETQADFSPDPVEQRRLYELALGAAIHAGLPTYSIRLDLAGVLFDAFDEPGRALEELEACREEVAEEADESDQARWSGLFKRCSDALRP